ncbi:TPA: QacE family quaternary ammonium compound efflux SMR transporter, partial [Raoultella ornithinolytica]
MSSKTKCWLWMLLVILSETSATSTLKMFGSSEGTTKMLLLGLLVLLYCTCYYSL